MSAFSMNSIPILDNNAMGGFRGGMSDHRSLIHSNNQLETEDLAQDEAIQRIEKNKLNTPLEAAERALKLAEAAKLQAEMDSGQYEKDRERKRASEQASLQKQLNDNQTHELEKRLKGMDATNAIFGPEANEATMAMGWETAKVEGKKYGFDIGEYNKENVDRYMRMRNEAPMMQKLYYDSVKRNEDMKAGLIEKGADANWKSAEAQRHEGWQSGENEKNRKNNLAVANTRAASSGGSGGALPKTWGQLEARTFVKVSEYLEGRGDPPSDAEIQLLENKMVRSEAMQIVKENPMFSIYFIPGTDSVDPSKADASVQAKIEAALRGAASMTTSGQLLARVRAKKGGGATPSAGAASSRGATAGWGKVTVEGK